MVPNGTAYADYPIFAGSGTKVKPSPDSKYAQGFLPGETLPAEWANYLFYGATGGVTRLNSDTDSIKKELNSILTAYGITNNADAYNQVLIALNRIYPQVCTCDTAAATEIKSVAITGDGVILKAGNVYAITMTNGNTYGDGSSTYPKLSINSGTAKPLCDASGKYLKSGAWAAGDIITVLYTGTKFLMATATEDAIENGNQKAVTSNAVSCILAANTTVTGPRLGTGGNVKIMFTADITGADGTTPLTIAYNGTSLAVKVCKNGAKAAVYAHEVSAGTFKFLQAYTTLELVFDGTDLVIVGNPVVLSSADYTIYADGQYESLSYSTEEKWTGRYYKDGKKIYEKTIDIGNLPNAGNKDVLHNISNLDNLVILYGSARESDTRYPLPFVVSSTAGVISVYLISGGYLRINTGTNRSNMTGVVTLEYTKTTD